MSEENKMTEENKKTIIAFVAGLLVGGLLVFIFGGSTVDETAVETGSDEESELPEGSLEIEEETGSVATGTATVTESGTPPVSSTNGTGSIEVGDQPAGNSVTLGNVVLPANIGWIGVRDYENGQLTGLLGVSRFSVAEGLSPRSVRLLRPTEAGRTYAVVFYSDNGDRVFNLATDAQIGGTIATFVAR